MAAEKIPRERDGDDYTREMADKRRAFVEGKTGVRFSHVNQYSFEPTALKGNIENFSGVAQIPIGFAGPLLVNGEHAQGEFYVPLATTEGSLVASYNRGMGVLYECGGVTTTVTDDCMQRAPVFVFDNARDAREFGTWVDEHFADIKKQAENTTKTGKLVNIDKYLASRMIFLRFNFTTGDAAGQNMVGKATFFACHWIRDNYPKIRFFALSGNLDTDKKSSYINTLRTRGKRVTAEATIPNHLVEKLAKFPINTLYRLRQISNFASFMAGSNNNGNHSANGITAMFIATGQDVANVAESSAALIYTEVTPDGDYYYSVTIPSLIVATYGGGTGLATQRECLQMMDCYGKGKVNKLAEIVAAAVLCGELSLGTAIVAGDWVTAHEKLGRNRP